MIHIQTVAQTQLDELAELYTELDQSETNVERLKERFTALQSNPDYTFLGAVDNSGKLVGSVMGIRCYDLTGQCRPFMVLENMIVSKSHHRKGIGQILVEAIEKIAIESDCRSVVLLSSAWRTDAHQFYEKLGFTKDATYGFIKPLNK
ncbi:GNAT family N-acetyltransferase [Paenibacillus alvei]|uniref:GNAT family N-acetyltransferase n=1 Tax=Paenibacillus TaxID=44249 RepID=UPI00028A35C1|nr:MULTISPECIES: GNAT family N-acetyltransferase [Paenibacillus]EJW16300.1 putative acetyltransferase, GNAT family [Paenibacillus alvei DSM 29]MCY7483056.1 GNAT family N-acetyltransferase [Paenibacillus alvei]MCY9543252.1 GNAT family N-acetyltransferase [Paenibacillus alvei]MCY9704372.1 GNAT family N-acetyltransferase [Paenibacillus alvei]MCY9737361.1 GNAT family N-acetyltransferase [Paenibacillus alvei]